MQEHDIQNAIRLHISQQRLGVLWRANVGTAWTGDTIKKLPDGSLLIINPRPFNTGLPVGFSDLFGFAFTAGGPIPAFIEVKQPNGRVRPEQQLFLDGAKRAGCRAGIARSPTDAERIMRGANDDGS